jgi:hypothetical protein
MDCDDDNDTDDVLLDGLYGQAIYSSLFCCGLLCPGADDPRRSGLTEIQIGANGNRIWFAWVPEYFRHDTTFLVIARSVHASESRSFRFVTTFAYKYFLIPFW